VSIPHPYRPSALVHGLPGIYFGLILIVPLLSEAGVLILALLGAGVLAFSRADTLNQVAWLRRDNLISSALLYGPSNGLLVVFTAWIWWRLRKDADPA